MAERQISKSGASVHVASMRQELNSFINKRYEETIMWVSNSPRSAFKWSVGACAAAAVLSYSVGSFMGSMGRDHTVTQHSYDAVKQVQSQEITVLTEITRIADSMQDVKKKLKDMDDSQVRLQSDLNTMKFEIENLSYHRQPSITTAQPQPSIQKKKGWWQFWK